MGLNEPLTPARPLSPPASVEKNLVRAPVSGTQGRSKKRVASHAANSEKSHVIDQLKKHFPRHNKGYWEVAYNVSGKYWDCTYLYAEYPSYRGFCKYDPKADEVTKLVRKDIKKNGK